MRKLVLFALCVGLIINQLGAQTSRTVTGKVTDENGAALPAVTVTVTGTNIRTTSDASGTFSINVPASATSLEFSYVGYATKTITLGSSNVMNVGLIPAAGQLTEVVVQTGYGTIDKTKYAGASSKVSEKAIRNVPMASFDQMLQGRAPGLTILSGSGQPGSNATVILRGPTSIQGGSEPLYIVDGIPVEAGAFQGINANDIATIDVLKDASAAAMYGSRGAAGVIVVTTKKGKAGKMKLGYSGQYGVKFTPEFGYEPMSSSQLFKTQEQLGLQIPNSTMDTWGTNPVLPGWQYSTMNPNKLIMDPVTGDPMIVAKTPADYAFGTAQLDSLSRINTNWFDEFFQRGTFSNNEISLSGGEGRTRIYSNLGMYKEEGVTKPTDMTRYSLRTNVDYKDNKLTLALNSIISYTQRNLQMNPLVGFNQVVNPFGVAQLTPKYITPKLPDGRYNVGSTYPLWGGTSLQKLQYDRVYNDQVKTTLSASLNYDFTKTVYAGIVAGVDFRETNNTTYNDPRVFDTKNATNIRTQSGSMTESLTRFFQPTARVYAGYRNTFKQDHSLDATVYAEIIKTKDKFFSATGYGIDTLRPNTLAAVTAGNAANQLYQVVGGTKSQREMHSLMANVRYTYRQKYSLNLTGRYDAVSFLPEENRSADFYSVGAVWDIAKEDFISSVSFVNALRLKASWGQAANADNFPFGDFGYLAQYATNVSLTSAQQGVVPSTSGNPEADWEYTNTTNIGLEFSLFKNRFYGDFQVYDKRTKNLFATLTLSVTAAPFGQQDVNAGTMYNKGIEYNLNYDIIRNRSLTWTVTANGAYNKNKVTSLGAATSFEAGTELIKVGLPLGSHYEVRWAGVDAATGSPLFYTADGKLTNAYSSDDRVQEFGTWIPPVTGGFGTSLTLKNFDLSVFFNYAAKTYRVNNMEFFMQNPGFLQQGLNQDAGLKFWTKPGDIANVQSPLYQNSFSSRLIQDASWLRLRNVTLSYNLPQSVLTRSKVISTARFYITGQNLLTWTSWRGLDPEDSNNISLTEYPNPRAITAGIDITF